MVMPNYRAGDFSELDSAGIAARFPYGQVRILLDIARGVPESKRSPQLTSDIGKLEGALRFGVGEFVQGARNVH